MTDSRFTTVAHDLDDLFSVVDIDEIADIETLLIILFGRPIGVEAVARNDGTEGSLEVTVWTDDMAAGSQSPFPMSVLGLVRTCAAMVAELGETVGERAEPIEESPDVLVMDEGELIATLQRALGEVRLFNILATDA